MTDRLIYFLSGLSGRERLLLALLVFLVLPLGIWSGLVEPLGEQREAARVELAQAVILRQWVDQRVREKQRLTLADEGADRPPIGVAGLERSLIEAGLRDELSELTKRGEGRVELRFDAVAFVELGEWINRVSLGWGYQISELRVERGAEDGFVSASLRLVPGP